MPTLRSIRQGELGHADQQSVEVMCTRCKGQRWIPMPYIPLDRQGRAGAPQALTEGGFVCARCRGVLARRNVADPLPTPETLERLAQARQSNPGGRFHRKEATRTLSGTSEAFSTPTARPHPPLVHPSASENPMVRLTDDLLAP
jgi:hypothetical protein